MLDKKGVSERIRKLRGTETQTTFGKKYGMSQGQIGHIETGRTVPSLGFLLILSFEYCVSVDFILKGKKSDTGEFQNLKKKAMKKLCKKLKIVCKEISDLTEKQ